MRAVQSAPRSGGGPPGKLSDTSPVTFIHTHLSKSLVVEGGFASNVSAGRLDRCLRAPQPRRRAGRGQPPARQHPSRCAETDGVPAEHEVVSPAPRPWWQRRGQHGQVHHHAPQRATPRHIFYFCTGLMLWPAIHIFQGTQYAPPRQQVCNDVVCLRGG